MGRLVHAATALGDAAFLLPASLALFFVLLWRAPRVAALWAATLVVFLSLTVAAKLAFHGCGPRLRSPSGHTAFSALFYGCAALVLMAGLDRLTRWAIGIGAVALVAVISVSRLWLDVHSPEEVVAGLLIGGVGVAVFSWLRPPMERPVISVPVLGAGLVLLALLVGGRHFGIEHWVGRGARWLPAFDLCL